MRAKGRNVLPKVNATGERHGTHTKPKAFPRGEQHHTHRRPETRPFGERNGQAVLTDAAVRDIRARRRQGERVIALAGAFGVSVRAIRFVVDRQTWSQVEDE